MPSRGYDTESDAGDISLFPSSHSESNLSSLLRSPPRASRERDITSPTPTRLFGKTLWPSTSATAVAPTVSLNDEEEGPTIAGPSNAVAYRERSRTADPRNRLRSDNVTPTKPPSNRRSSSNGSLTRSRSLKVRLSSVDLSDEVSPTRAPLSATTRTPSMRLGWHRRPGDPRPPPLVNEDVGRRMSRWVKEIVVCNFDLERGPVVERRAGGRRWGQGEKENVAFSSFPDTSLFAEGSIQFSFKIRHIPPEPATLYYPEPPSPMPEQEGQTVEQGLLNVKPSISDGSEGSLGASTSLKDMSTAAKTEEYRRWDERGREWLYGFVWFEQRRDKGIARGYMQKSLVILTHLPFPALFVAVLDRIAPAFFKHGYPVLEAACHSIATWPDPSPDTVLELPLMTDLLLVQLPDNAETPQVGAAFIPPSPERPILASLPTSTPLRAFASCLPSLWSLWECLILAEPILIIAPDPRKCSEIVWWLRDMLRPIPPGGDFRPYLHIHDHDFSLLVNSNKPQAGVVVGVTNPFFRNAASHWPNVISITSDRPRRSVPNGVSPSPSPRPDAPEGFLSRRHRSVQKDRGLLKRLEGLVAEGRLDDPAGNEALRTHFQQLTEKMLVPLNRYFQTLLPSLSSPSPATPDPTPVTLKTIRPFSLPNFLTHLRTHGPNPLTFRTKGLSTKARVETDFYAAFCMSASFAGWLGARVQSMGMAVVANQSASSLGVPGRDPPRRGSLPAASPSDGPAVGLGFVAPGAFGERRSPKPGGKTSESDKSDVRLSSDVESVSPTRWRASEESPREEEEKEMASYFGGRRKSEGQVKALSMGSVTPRAAH